MGIFTPGSLVKLSDIEVAIVLGQANSVDEPVLAILTQSNEEALDPPALGIKADKSEVTGILDLNDHLPRVNQLGEVWPQLNAI